MKLINIIVNTIIGLYDNFVYFPKRCKKLYRIGPWKTSKQIDVVFDLDYLSFQWLTQKGTFINDVMQVGGGKYFCDTM